MKKFLIGAAAVIVIGATGVGIWLYQSLDAAAERAIEQYGGAATQTPVRVESVHISLDDGTGLIKGFSVGNPRGFRAPYAMSADTIKISLDPATLAREAVVVRALSIVAPHIAYESGQAGSNFDAILGNVLRYAAGPGGAKGSGRKLVIERLVIRDAQLSYAPAIPSGRPVTLPLPEIRLSGIGAGKGGVSAGELSRVVLEALLAHVKRAASLGAGLPDGR